jgi:hypothetical protein
MTKINNRKKNETTIALLNVITLFFIEAGCWDTGPVSDEPLVVSVTREHKSVSSTPCL